MAYNYGPPPGAYGGAPQFPPNMPNMPGINLNAPVLRFNMGNEPQRGPQNDRGGGRDGRGGGDRRGGPPMIGGDSRNLDRERAQLRENMMAMQPPTREEVARTIFVGGLGENAPGDEQLERLLACAGKLRRWTRARDQHDKRCAFGFAEYEDSDSLDAAAEIFKEVEVPLFNADGSVQREGDSSVKKEENGEDVKMEDGENKTGEVKKAKLMVMIDEASIKYINEWKGKGRETEDQRTFRIEGCKEEMRNVLQQMVNANAHHMNGRHDRDGDYAMDGANGDGVEVLHLPNNIDDELADIPVEQRATVAEEIKAFRHRSHRRDLQRADDEQEAERAEEARNARARSPPAGSTNGIPVGPRGNAGVHGAPSGPKGFRGAQIPSDYVNGVNFVGQNGAGPYIPIREDEDASESDDELERRHQARQKEELDQQFKDNIRRWQNRERTRGAAQERERKREEDEKRNFTKARDDMLLRLANWSEDDERRHAYYKDPSSWYRNRAYALERERREDEEDRRAEERELEEERMREAGARGQAEDFLSNMSNMQGVERTAAPQQDSSRVKISLGTAKREKAATAPVPAKRANMDVEGLLDDEEDAAMSGANKQLSLKPLQDTSTLPVNGQDLTPEERAAARRQLAAEIPADKDALYAYPIKWEYLTKELVEGQIRPFVERKVLELLGMQEGFLVEAILEGVRDRMGAVQMEGLVEGALDEEAGVMVRKVWRLLVFWGECEMRGLGGED